MSGPRARDGSTGGAGTCATSGTPSAPVATTGTRRSPSPRRPSSPVRRPPRGTQGNDTRGRRGMGARVVGPTGVRGARGAIRPTRPTPTTATRAETCVARRARGTKVAARLTCVATRRPSPPIRGCRAGSSDRARVHTGPSMDEGAYRERAYQDGDAPDMLRQDTPRPTPEATRVPRAWPRFWVGGGAPDARCLDFPVLPLAHELLVGVVREPHLLLEQR